MNPQDPGLRLYLMTGLLMFWLIPLSSWVLLRGQRDRPANLWFAGTAMYAVAATLFVLPGLPAAPRALAIWAFSVVPLLCMIESLRLERDTRAAPLAAYAAIVALDLALCALRLTAAPVLGFCLHLVLLSALEFLLAGRLLETRRRAGSRALGIVVVVVLALAFANLARVVEMMITQRVSGLLDFTGYATFALTVNYLSPIFYTFGYWGFVLEKSRAEREVADRAFALARERERVARAHVEQRNLLIQQLVSVGKLAQSAALSASIAHEVSQPLAVVRLNLEEAAEALRQSDLVRAGRLLETAQAATLRTAGVVQRVRDMFAKGRRDRGLHCIDDVIRLVQAVMQERLAREQVEVVLSLAAAAPFLLAEDELEHVLINLIQNSLDAFAAAGSPDRRIDIRSRDLGDRVRVEVADNGPGVPAEARAEVFNLFHTLKPGGLGLGLWLARHIVERHGGSIVLVPTEGPGVTGATFAIELPKAIA